jgi:oxygen-independent coproporphyrinogen-3 oxidase
LAEKDYEELFSSDLKKDFSFWLRLGEATGLFNKTEQGWALTERGSYQFHWVEQKYTHQYIDKTWKLAMGTPWPEKISLY